MERNHASSFRWAWVLLFIVARLEVLDASSSSIWLEHNGRDDLHDIRNGMMHKTSIADRSSSLHSLTSQQQASLLFSSDHVDDSMWNSLSQAAVTAATAGQPLFDRRRMAQGDFDAFNELFANAVIFLPDADVSTKVLGATLTLNIRNLTCQDLSFGDIVIDQAVDSSIPPQQILTMNVTVNPFALNCFGDYSYKYTFARGSGRLSAYSDQNQAMAGIQWTSQEGFEESPPNQTTLASCQCNLNVYDLSFEGGIVSDILDAAENLVANLIESQTESLLCQEMALVPTLLDNLLSNVTDWINPFLLPIPPTLSNPLQAEQSFQIPPDTNVLNFLSMNATFGNLVHKGLDWVNSRLGETVNDPNSPTGTGEDLGINKLLRDNILDAQRAFTVVWSDLPESMRDAGVISVGGDKTTITIDTIQIFGLDTMKQFVPVQPLGQYTLQSQFAWDVLDVELSLIVELKPGQDEGSIIQGLGDVHVVENITVSMGVNQFQAALTLFLALDVDRGLDLSLGPLLSASNLLPCFYSTLLDMQIAGLDLQIASIDDPVLQHFIAPGIDRVVTDLVKSIFVIFEPTVLRALPHISETSLRSMLSKVLVDPIFNETSPNNRSSCPMVDSPTDLIDFRDFFLKGDSARSLGGTGEEPYGDIVPRIYMSLMNTLSAPTEKGSLRVNDMLIAPLTQMQSNVTGHLRFPSDLFRVEFDSIPKRIFGTSLTSIEVALSDFRVNNLNTVIAPLELLYPTTIPTVLNTLLTLDNDPANPLQAVVRFSLSIDGDYQLFPTSNSVDVSLSLNAFQLMLDLQMLITTADFLQLPLSAFLAPDCWLGLFQQTALDETGNVLEPNATRGLSVESFVPALESLVMNATCHACHNAGVERIAYLITLLVESGAFDPLATRLPSLVTNLAESSSVQLILDRLVSSGHKSCPSNPSRQEMPMSQDSFTPIPIPVLPKQDIDTLFYTALMFAWVTLLLIGDVNRYEMLPPSDPLLPESMIDPAGQGLQLLNWTDLAGSSGLGHIGELAVEGGLSYLGGGTTLGINAVLENIMDDGIFNFEFNNLILEADGLSLSLDAVRLYGLHNFTRFDVAQPIGFYTLNNFVDVEYFAAELDVSAGYKSEPEGLETVTVRIELRQIEVEVSLFTAVDVRRLNALQIGSLLSTGNIFECVTSTLHDVRFPSVAATVAEFLDPMVFGLMNETSNAATSSIDFIAAKYKSEILESIPLLLNAMAKEIGSAVLLDYALNSACPPPPNSSAPFVDFRELFGNDSSILYGDLPSTLRKYLDSDLLAQETNSTLSRLNRILIDPLTQRQSGEKGNLKFSMLPSISTEKLDVIGFDMLYMNFSSLQVENLNSVKTPVTLLEPDANSSQLLRNRMAVGSIEKPIRVSTEFLVAISGDPALASRNTLDLVVELPYLDIQSSVFARLGFADLMTFPLGRIGNVNCLASLFDLPELDDEGLRIPGDESPLGLDELFLNASSMKFDIACSDADSCSTPGLHKLPEILVTLGDSGISSALQTRMAPLITELLNSDTLQVVVDRALVYAAERCSANISEFLWDARILSSTPPFPALSLESLETISLLGMFASDVALSIVAEGQGSWREDGSQPPMETLVGIDGKRLLDLSTLNETIGSWADEIIGSLTSFLGESENGEIGINRLIRSYLLDESNTLSLNFDDLAWGDENFSVALKHVEIQGLDSFESFELNISGPQLISNSLKLAGLDFKVDIAIGSRNTSAVERALGENMNLQLEFAATGISGGVSLILGIDQDDLGQITMADILNIDDIVGVVFSTFSDLSFSHLDFSLQSIDTLQFSGFKSRNAATVADELNSAFLHSYVDSFAKALPSLFNGKIRAMLNGILLKIIEDAREERVDARNTQSASTTSFIDFRDLFLAPIESAAFGGQGSSVYGDLFRTLRSLMTKELLRVDPSTELAKINDLVIRKLTANGSKSFPGDLFAGKVQIAVGGLNADIAVRIYDAYVSNLDTIGAPLSLLDPIVGQGHELNNTASIGIGRPVQFGSRFFFQFSGDGADIRNDLDINLDFSSATALLDFLLKIVELKFLTFPLKDALNPFCWLDTLAMPSLDSRGIREEGSDVPFSILDLVIVLDSLRLNVTCIECSSPKIVEMSELLTSSTAVEGSTEVANRILEYISNIAKGGLVEVLVDRQLANAGRKCPHSPSYNSNQTSGAFDQFQSPTPQNSFTFFIAIAVVGAILLVVCLAVGLFVKAIVRRRHRRWLTTLEDHHIQELWSTQEKENEKMSLLDRSTRSMFRADEVPKAARWLIPLIILGNIAFFLSGHLSLGGSVVIVANIGGEKYEADDFFDFSIAKSTVHIWQAGGRELAILILIFSGIWPYLKQLTTLYLWFVPTRTVSVATRGNIFLWLDALAKWSMVDVFVLILMIVGFRVSILSPAVAFLPSDFYSLDLVVVPKWGLYANMIAQLISQISSHFAIFYHRSIVTKWEQSQTQDERTAAQTGLELPDCFDPEDVRVAAGTEHASIQHDSDKLAVHAFVRSHRRGSEDLVVRAVVSPFVVTTTILSAVLITIGCSLPSFSVEVLGIVGLAVESGQGFHQAVKDYNVFETVRALMDQANFTGKVGDYVGLGALSVLLVVSVLLVPIFQATLLLYQWFKPMSRSLRHYLDIVMETAVAWEYASVYLVAVVITSWQLGSVSKYLVNVYCSSLANIFGLLAANNIIKDEDAQCFSVNATVESGSYVLAVGVTVLALLSHFIMKASHQYFRDTSRSQIDAYDGKLIDLDAEERQRMISSIDPVPVLFSDRYRWCLRHPVPSPQVERPQNQEERSWGIESLDGVDVSLTDHHARFDDDDDE